MGDANTLKAFGHHLQQEAKLHEPGVVCDLLLAIGTAAMMAATDLEYQEEARAPCRCLGGDTHEPAPGRLVCLVCGRPRA